MREIKKIIIHCSDSVWADAFEIDKWHKERGFVKIGYHYVVLNAYPTFESFENKNPQDTIGVIQKGRSDEEIGAHVKDMNSDTIGICLIGKNDFSYKQQFSAAKLTVRLLKQYGLSVDDVLGHCECPTGKEQGKTCPNLSMPKFRFIITTFIRLQKIYKFNKCLEDQ